MSNRSYTREEIILLLEGVVGKTLGEVDKNNIFERTKRSPKITGIAGDVIEQSVIGYSADSRQEPDILIDNVEVEIKTTGLRKTRSNSESATSIVAKEPMTITAVSPEKIIYEKFDNSNLWHKLKNMLLVYYLYDSEVTVPASEYAEFPILGYQFLKFSEQDKKIIENDWKIVRNYIRGLATNLDNPKDGYAGISKLRENMLYMDTAPKYPNPPRFRLRRKVVSGIAQKHFLSLIHI